MVMKKKLKVKYRLKRANTKADLKERQGRIDRAYAILFEEVFKLDNEKK
jgi:hypothetical protein